MKERGMLFEEKSMTSEEVEIGEGHPLALKLEEKQEKEFPVCFQVMRRLTKNFGELLEEFSIENDFTENKVAVSSNSASLPKHLDNFGGEGDTRKVTLIV